MKNNLTIPLLLFSLIIFGQQKLPFIDVEEISNLAAESSQNGDIEKTLEILSRVNKNDSTFCSVMVSKSYYLMALKKYDEAIEMIDEGLTRNCGDSNAFFYVNKGVALLNQKKYIEATEVIDKGIINYPKNSLLWYNKGVLLEFQGKIEDAVEAYQTTILLNPVYRKAYFQLGNICYKQELISQALMCFNIYLLLEPDADDAFKILNSLDNVIKSKNENKRNPNIEVSPDDTSFEELDLIINNRIALNTNYKTGNEIDIALIRQNHALLQQLEEFKGKGGFWDTKFVTLFKWIQNNGYFDAFSYTISYSIENKQFKPVIEKKIKEITEFLAKFKSKWFEILQQNEIEWYGKKEEITFSYNDGSIQASGRLNQDTNIGPWEFYNENGRLTGIGSFDDKGNRNGQWSWFNEFGQISETVTYLNGKLNGKYSRYHKNGQLEIDSQYANDKFEGEYKYYNDKGALIQKKYFQNDKLNGMFTSYFNVGEKLPEFKIQYNEGQIDSKKIEYFANGKVYSEMDYKNGKLNGFERKYYYDGDLSSKVNYVDGVLQGSVESFYPNRNPYEIGQSFEGYYEGDWKTYYDNGAIQIEYSYKQGNLDGYYKYYDFDGKPFYEYEYRKGEMLGFRFFD